MVASSIDALGASVPLPAAAPAAGSAQPADTPNATAVSPPRAPGFDPNSVDGGVKALEDALNAKVERLLSGNIRLEIEKDSQTGHFIYKSIDAKTGELKRQYPAEDILRLLQFFHELDGLLYDAQA